MRCASSLGAIRFLRDEVPASGKSILVVEDEFLVAAMLQDFLERLGAIVVGPAYDVEHAMQLANSEVLDASILDINVRDLRIDPVAEALASRKIPFAFATGYSSGVLHKWSGVPVLVKPYSEGEVARILKALNVIGRVD